MEQVPAGVADSKSARCDGLCRRCASFSRKARWSKVEVTLHLSSLRPLQGLDVFRIECLHRCNDIRTIVATVEANNRRALEAPEIRLGERNRKSSLQGSHARERPALG